LEVINNPTWDINDPITVEEIQNTVLDMKNNKAPGPDGIPTEFLVAPSKQALKKILNMVHEWAIKNTMTFGINKCVSFVVKPLNFVKPINYEDPSFFVGSNKLPKTDNCTYLDIPFDEFLSLKPIQSKLNSNLKVKLNSYFRFLINKSIPLPLKKYALISFILILVLYYAPLFCSNKSRCAIAQKLLTEDFIEVMDLNLAILMLVSMILLVN